MPGTLLSAVLLATGTLSSQAVWTLGLLVVGLWVGFASAARERVVRSLQTISNLLAALHEGDYSIRGRAVGRDALGEVMRELNALAKVFQDQRLFAIDATSLLRTVMTEIDVAVFVFDQGGRLKLINPAGESVLGQSAERLLGRSAVELGLSETLAGKEGVVEATFHGGPGRWGVRRKVFRQEGEPHQLLVMADVSKALREEERQAFRRLIRVLGHELNNSLTPITSIADSLASLLSRQPRQPDWEEDARRGLAVIGTRSSALRRFLDGYSRLARLPAPRLAPVSVAAVVRRAAALPGRLPVRVVEGEDAVVSADSDQLEQLLINLLTNAVDASEAGGDVSIGWRSGRAEVEIWVEDEGPGLAETANLFVPFFTTKPQGSGIGLVLCRQIAEAHGGSVRLGNRSDRSGCRATVLLPPVRKRLLQGGT